MKEIPTIPIFTENSNKLRLIPMETIKVLTSQDYADAVKNKYEAEKTGVNATFLSNPSPALLKQFIITRLDDFSKIDHETLNRFFNFIPGKERITQIEDFDTDKFRPISNFCRGKTKSIQPLSLELIAALIDFQPRPLNKFLLSAKEDKVATGQKEETLSRVTELSTHSNKFANFPQILPKQIKIRRLVPLIIISILVIIIMTLALYQPKNCMIWTEDHYEAIDCDKRTDKLVTSAAILPMDAKLLEFQKKIIPSDTTTFFVEGRPVIWYIKSSNEIEYFTYPGLHPVNGKTLKPITPYIVNKYVNQ